MHTGVHTICAALRTGVHTTCAALHTGVHTICAALHTCFSRRRVRATVNESVLIVKYLFRNNTEFTFTGM